MLNVEEPVKTGAVVVAVASAILGGILAKVAPAKSRRVLAVVVPLGTSYALLFWLDWFKTRPVELSRCIPPFIFLWCYAGILSWTIATLIIRRWDSLRKCLNNSCIGEWWGAGDDVFSSAPVDRQQRYIVHRTIAYTGIFALVLTLAMSAVGIESPDILLFWGLCIGFLWLLCYLIKKQWIGALAESSTPGYVGPTKGKARGWAISLVFLGSGA
jgi:hypothetical protein